MDTNEMYDLLKSGTPEQRQEFARTLPPSTFKDQAVSLLGFASEGMVVVALGPSAIEYSAGRAPATGAALAFALHKYAIELFEGKPGSGLIPTTLSGLADSFIRAANALGQSRTVMKFTDQYIPYYTRLPEKTNLPSLKIGRIAALVNLGRLEEAQSALDDAELLGNPATDIEVRRLRKIVNKQLGIIVSDGASAVPSATTVDDEFVASTIALLKQHVTTTLPERPELEKVIDTLADKPRVDASDPTGLTTLIGALRQGEEVLKKGGTDSSELSIRGRVREASVIFALQPPPAPQQIRTALEELEECRRWARDSGIAELENDALYGVYLCHSRLGNPSAAADALLELRRNLERVRSGIDDVVKRGGAFTTYPQLFGALCEKLHRAARLPELLESIEASKGRGVADILTVRSKRPVGDATIYAAVAQLPSLCARHQFHYITYFVDDDLTYAVLVSPDGEIRAPAPIPLSRATIRRLASARNPDAPEPFAPLVSWLEPLLADGTIAAGAHLCVAADDDLANVPFAFLPLNGRPLIDTLSASRIHNAYHLAHVLHAAPHAPTAFLGIVVPTLGNVSSVGWTKMREAMVAPIDAVAEALPGEVLEGTAASTEALESRELTDRIIHFSTHGTFPASGAPFERSGLILADGNTLPVEGAIALKALLTPRRIFEDDLTLNGSHVSMMACVSGLSREGVGGDALGMDWAMIQAGAASVLSTHWKVSATLAGIFLSNFYREWLGNGQTRADALRTTIAAMRAAGGSQGEPRAWAAFSLTGDWR